MPRVEANMLTVLAALEMAGVCACVIAANTLLSSGGGCGLDAQLMSDL